jgi:hypothetical protein
MFPQDKTTIRGLHAWLVETINGKTGRSERKLANNTYGSIIGELVTIRYHATNVAEIRPDSATYRTGGWWTVTTKERINWYLPDGWHLSSGRGVWWLSARTGTRLVESEWGDYTAPVMKRMSQFFDELTLVERDGDVSVLAPVMDDPDKELRRQINEYVALYTDETLTRLIDRARESGTNGDCLYCQLAMSNPGFESGGDHLELHVEEGYAMVTLAANALTAAGYKPEIYLGTWSEHWRDGNTIRRSIRKYMQKRLLHKTREAA